MNEPEQTGTCAHNLLIIDDERDILSALRRQFRKDYKVHIAASAEEGLELMTEHPIQVIISDQRMPGMKGAEFFDRVKHDFPDATRLLLTGYADIQAVIEAINDGNIFRYITKPWDPVELNTIVREAFDRHDLIVKNKQLLDALQEANMDLEKRVDERTASLIALNNQKDRMIGIVAHDLLGPLGTIRMCNEVTSASGTSDSVRTEFYGLIEETTEKAIQLITDLLDVSAIATGNLVLKKREVLLHDLLAKVIRHNTPLGANKGIDLELVDEAPDSWNIDSHRIEQVLDNLIGNAFKYSHSETKVTLRAYEEKQHLRIDVTDQGQGIRAEEMDQLFGEFQKTNTLPTGSESSNGLGLSICKRIVELHGGTIQASSEFGVGSMFSIALPQGA